MPDYDCDELAEEQKALAEKIAKGLKEEKAFNEEYKEWLKALDKEEEALDDHISIQDQEDVDYDDLDNEIKRKQTALFKLRGELSALEREWNDLLDDREPVAAEMQANEDLIDDYEVEAESFDCHTEPNASNNPQCISLNGIIALLTGEQSTFQLELDRIDQRLMSIPDDVEEKETEIDDEEGEIDDLKDEYDFQQRKKALDTERQTLKEIKAEDYPNAYNLQDNQDKKAIMDKKITEHCTEEPATTSVS